MSRDRRPDPNPASRRVPTLVFPDAILKRTEHWIAIDKPAGLPSRPAPGYASSALRQLEDHFVATEPTAPRPGVVHRLDIGTSGVLLFSLGPEGHRALREAWRQQAVRKQYCALVLGALRPKRGRIDLPLERNASGRIVVARGGRPSSTRYETLATKGALSLVLLEPLTGRTHQLRVHLASRGAPVLGDRRYGPPGSPRREARLYLHARTLRLPSNAADSSVLSVESPLPGDFAECLLRSGFRLP